jgi:hypothetical protein
MAAKRRKSRRKTSNPIIARAVPRTKKLATKTARRAKRPKLKVKSGGTRKHVVDRAKKLVTKTVRKSKRPKLKLKSGDTRKLPKIHLRSKHKKPKQKHSLQKRTPQIVAPKRAIHRKRPQRVMFLFSAGKAIRAKVSRKNASTVGEYLNAVDEFLKTNDPDHVAPFIGISIKDRAGKTYVFETRPNALYRLNAATEPFEEIYQILT